MKQREKRRRRRIIHRYEGAIIATRLIKRRLQKEIEDEKTLNIVTEVLEKEKAYLYESYDRLLDHH